MTLNYPITRTRQHHYPTAPTLSQRIEAIQNLPGELTRTATDVDDDGTWTLYLTYQTGDPFHELDTWKEYDA